MHSLTFYVLQKTNLISWNDLVKVMDKFAAFASISREEAFRRCYTMYNVYESAFSRIADKEERYFETFLGLYAINEILPNLSLNINQHRNASEVILNAPLSTEQFKAIAFDDLGSIKIHRVGDCIAQSML